MSREGLKKFLNAGLRRFYAEVLIVSQYEHRFSQAVPTICLKNVRIDKANTVTDHAWIRPTSMEQGEQFPSGLEVGDTVGFVAGIAKYEKGIFGQQTDYGLVNIKSIEVISKRKI